jgi:hypothetical protein
LKFGTVSIKFPEKFAGVEEKFLQKDCKPLTRFCTAIRNIAVGWGDCEGANMPCGLPFRFGPSPEEAAHASLGQAQRRPRTGVPFFHKG